MLRTDVHSVPRTLTLHLLPGALATVFFFLAGPPLIRAGYPPLLALLLAILVILIPFELGYLFYEGKRLTGSFSLRSVVSFREPIPIRQYLVSVPLLLAWSVAAFAILARFEAPLAKALSSWLPDWWVSAFSPVTISQYPKRVLVASFIAGLALNGIAGPVVEELYFRGYLLPRIPAPRTWAPLINIVLFSLYHFFSPWQFFTRVVACLPWVYAVSWKRNIYIGILTHTALNTVGWIVAFALLAGRPSTG